MNDEQLKEWRRYARYWEQHARLQTDRLRDIAHGLNVIRRAEHSGDHARAAHELNKVTQIATNAIKPRALRPEPLNENHHTQGESE